MSSAGSDAVQVYLGQDTVGVVGHDASVGVQWLPASSPLNGWEQAAALLATSGRRRAVVLLSGALARPFVFEAMQGLSRWREAELVAASLAPEATGLTGPCAVWLGDWEPDRASIVVAIERWLREGIETSARQQGVQLAALRPWWVGALNDAVKNAGETPRLLAFEDPDALTTLCGADGAFTAASSHSPRPDANQVQALINRTILGSNVPVGRAMRVVMEVQGGGFGARSELAG